MKKSAYVSFLCILLTLSCTSNKDAEIDPVETGEPTQIVVNLVGAGQKQGATVPNPVNESKIGKGVILVFKGNIANPPLDGKASFDFTSGASAVTVNITAGTYRHIYVIANVNPSDFDGVIHRNDLYNLTSKAAISTLRTQTNLPMSGYQTDIDASASTPISLNISLWYICSRVSIDWNVDVSAPAGLTVNDAYLLNVKNYSDYFAGSGVASLTTNVNSFLYGRADISSFTGGDPSTSMLPSAQPTQYNTYDVALGMGGSISQKGFANNSFYMFENSEILAHTIVVIEATQSGTTYYYPIIINGEGNTTGGNKSNNVVRGNIYNVKANIKGFGNSDPYEPILRSVMDVTISAAAWAPTIVIEQDFN